SARSTQSSAKATARSAARTVETGAQAGAFTLEYVGKQAERAMLVPVGATLIARDNVVEAVRPYTKRTTAERELKKLQREVKVDVNKFERRGNTARNRVQREVKRTRTRVERELRQRGNQATRLVKRNRRDFERQVGEVQQTVTSVLP
ncbi:MAG: hypothetical protein M3370_03345, partial [Actinomycetota bacterium]|nr:hypothetical protein [Actinomycetota bacterium]